MAAPEFCHLHVHTQYSLLDGACRIDLAARKAAETGMPAVAITDHGNMYGVVEFYRTMRAHGVKPIIGYEGYFTPGDRRVRQQSGRAQRLDHLTFLAADQTGYRNLIRLSSMAYLEGLYYRPRIDWELLEDCAEGLICLSGCMHGRLNNLAQEGRREEAAKWLGDMRDLFGPDRFYVELQNHGLPEQVELIGPATELARRVGVPVVATNDCHFLEAEDQTWHDVLLCINTRSTLDDPDRFRMETDQIYFKSPDEMARAFPDHPEALSNTVRVAEMCSVELDTERKYPAFRQEGVPPEQNPKLLRRLAVDGLAERYGQIPEPMRQRLDHELSVIEQMGYVDYFLIVWDFVRFAREQGIPVGLRGSGGGCLAAHALKITDINPMEHDLLFSRFLDPERQEPPDIDIDLCERRREEVIDYVRQRYGPRSTAQIITFGTLQARNCVRDVGRVLGVELKKVDRVAKMIPTGPKQTLEIALKETPELVALAREDEEVGRILDYARQIEGLPRHASTHAAGVVISDRPLWELVPLCQNADGEVMTQWAMDDLAKAGMLKMDFLGLSALTTVDQTVRIIREGGGEPPPLEADRIDTDDAETYGLLTSGLTRGVFQLGSGGMTRLLERLKPNCIEDLIAAVALYRPGPLKSGMVTDFIDRRHGRAEVTYPHPAFEPILRPTYGVLVYQEQIMRIADVIAHMSMADAYTMIKAIGKKDDDVIDARQKAFVDGAVANGIDQETAEEIFELIRHFGGYGFNKAHAAAYAFLAFITAYLKAHYPTEFMAASLSCEMGDTDEVVRLMEECSRMGIEVLPPEINQSGVDFTPVGDRVLRFGLGAVRNLGGKAIECILAARQEGGQFRNIFEFCERVDQHEVTRSAMEALMKAGCFDGLPGSRAQQQAILERAIKAGARVRRNRMLGQTPLFSGAREEDPDRRIEANLPEVPPLSHRELARQEHDALGLYVRYDPLVEHRRGLARYCTVTSDAMAAVPEGQEAVMGGMVENVRRRRTRAGDPMAVLKVLDLSNTFECVLFPRAWETFGPKVESGQVLFFVGRISHGRGTSLQADEVVPFSDAASRAGDSVLITISSEQADPETWAELAGILNASEGSASVFVDLIGDEFRLRSRAGNGTRVAPSEQLARRVEELLGTGAVRFAMRRGGRARRGARGSRGAR